MTTKIELASDLASDLAEIFALPKKWIDSRLFRNKNVSDTLFEVWSLNTEFGIPFCHIIRVPEKQKKPLDLIVQQFCNGVDASMIIVFNNSEHFIYRWNFVSKSCQKQVGNSLQTKIVEKKHWLLKNGGGNFNNDLIPLTSKVESAIFQIHSIIRDADALHPDTALDEICKILYVKIYDEETTKPGNFYKFQQNLYVSIEECASVIRRLYEEANEHDKRVYSLRIPGYKRSRGVFDQPIILSDEAIAKIVQRLQDYSFSNSELDIKGRVFQNLISPVLRGGFGQYFTPSEIVDLIVKIIQPTIDDLIIDPFAGSGHFLTSSIRFIKKNSSKTSAKKINDFLLTHLHGMEISERMVRISMTDMRLHGDGHSNVRCVDALLDFAQYQDLHKESFDVVITNPPFGSLVNTSTQTSIANFSLASNKKSVPLEILGLERSVELLRANGKLGIVLPDSIFVNSNLKYVREWILQNIQVIAIISLPIETFSPYGANIKTSVLIGKKLSEQTKTAKGKVFVADLKNIGYDASGRKLKSSDLTKMEKEFIEFTRKNRIQW